MIKDEYIAKIKTLLQKHLSRGDRVFVFGSAADSQHFNDVDLAISSKDNERVDKIIYKIKDDLEESNLPYKFDVVNINTTKDRFRTRVMNGPKIWII